MKNIFISLNPNTPEGFEYRIPTKQDILYNRVALFADSLEIALATLNNFSECMYGIVITNGKTFSHKSIGLELWHLTVTDNMLPDLCKITSFFFDIMTDGQKDIEKKNLRKSIEEKKMIKTALKKSELRFKQLVDLLPEAVFETDKNLKLTYVNQHIFELTGYSVEEFEKGVFVIDTIVPEDRDQVRENLIRRINGEYLGLVEYKFLRKDKSTFPILLNLIPIKNKEDITGFRGIFFDITERKRIEKALRESEEKFSKAFHSIPVIIGMSDLETGKYIEVNQAFYNKLGFTPEEVIGKKAKDLLLLDSRWIKKTLRKFKEQGFIRNEETVIFSKNGTPLNVWLSAEVIELAGEKYNFTAAIDITDRKLMEKEKEKLEKQLHQSDKMHAIGQLAGGIAHDFNNQLGIIVGFAGLLRDEVIHNKDLSLYIEKILLASRRSSDLTAQLLAFARKGKYILATVDLHKMVNEIVNILQHTIDKNIVIKLHLNAQKPITTGDPSQIQNAIMNLALNARDAMPRGGKLIFTTEIVILDEEYCKTKQYEIVVGEYILLSVSDSGCGMSKEIQRRMFEPFFTTKEHGKGTGMGLAAVYGTVKNHGGSISVYSEVDHGTTIKIYLPHFEENEKKEDSSFVKRDSIKGSARILLVDDEQMILDFCSRLLVDIGYKVTSCKNGEEAVEYYRNNWKDIDIVILDIVMPKMNGKITYCKMKKINPDIIVLISTGYNINGEAQEILDEGANGFIHKPFNQSEISNKIAEMLKGK